MFPSHRTSRSVACCAWPALTTLQPGQWRSPPAGCAGARAGARLATDVPESPDVALGGVLCLACADHAAAWTVEIAAGRLRWREGRGPADAVLVGSASDLYLYCWNRRPLEVLELTGNREVAANWSSLTV